MADEGAKSFLNSPDFPFQGEFKDWFAANAVWFDGCARPDDYPSVKQWRKGRPKVDQGFGAAQQFCLATGEGRYFEGVMLSDQPGAGPLLCAWVIMPDGGLVDFAQKAIKKKEQSALPKTRYFGIEIPTEFIAGLHEQAGYSQPLAKLYYTSQTTSSPAKEIVTQLPKSPLRRRRRKGPTPQSDGPTTVSEN